MTRSEESLERSRASSRDAKRRRRGSCVDCGAETRYNGHGAGVSERCLRCANARSNALKQGSGPRQALILDFLERNGPARFSEISRETGTPAWSMGQLISRLLAGGLIERVSRGIYRLPERGGSS